MLKLIITLACFTHAFDRINFNSAGWLGSLNPPWTEGMERTSRVLDKDLKRHVLEVVYPKGKYGNDSTGAQFKAYLDEKCQRAVLEYKVKFPADFDFVRGGKLPGLVGGHYKGHPDSVVSGGAPPKPGEGWSARIMWRTGGRIVQYMYHLNQKEKWGDDFDWKINQKPAKFLTGKWQTLRTEIILNVPGTRNGVIRSWLDGTLALERANLEFRKSELPKIDALAFSTFFGGDDESWSATKTEKVRFADFTVSCDK